MAQQQYSFTNYTQEQGLPSGNIRGIYKDTTGYLWLTSEEGVARFDGYNFKIFRHNPDDSTSLPSDIAWYGAFPRFGDIYFETAQRYCQFNEATESFSYKLPFGDTLGEFRIFDVKDKKDYYWAVSKFAIFKISQTGTERFALPFSIAPLEWKIIVSPDNHVLLSTIKPGKPGVLYVDEQTKAISKIKIVNREGLEDTSGFSDVFFTGKYFYLFTNKSAFRFNSGTRTFEWYFDLKQTGNFDYAFPPYLPLNDTLVVIHSNTGFLNIVNLRTGEEKLVYVNKLIPEAELDDRRILSSILDHQGGIWIGTTQMGIINYNLLTGELAQYIYEAGKPNSVPGSWVNMILPDEKGVVWASFEGHGLIKMEPETPLFKTAIPTVAKNSGNSGKGWTLYVRGFLETDDGYWIATGKGLFDYSVQTHQYINLQHLSPVSHSSYFNSYERSLSESIGFGCLAKDHSGNVWIGQWYGELFIYNPKLQRSFPIRPQTIKARSESVFRNLYCDRKNRMWISTHSSGICMIDCNALDLQKIDDIKFEYHSPDANDSTAIPPGNAFVVSEDAQGNIWAGTENGLCKYNEQTKKWKRYVNIPGDNNSIHNNNVRCISLDNKGTLWIGTNGGGLNRYNKAQDNFTHFTKANGLPDDRIYSLVCDNNGMLWMGTNHGLCRFNPLDYSCKNFSDKDGIQNYEYNTGAAVKLKDGTLLIGGIAGYNIIDPEKIEDKKSVIPVVITSFRVLDQEIPPGNKIITLNHEENNISFEFAALSYSSNQKNRYAYMLTGVDPDWIFSGNRRYVSYSKLKPGDYTFHVKASNSDGVWNETGTQLHITITPPWWLTWWAQSVYVLLCGIMVYLIFYIFNKRLALQHQIKTEHAESIRLKELDTFKSQLFTNLTHEFRTPLTVILGMTRQLTTGTWKLIVGEKEKSRISNSLELIENNGQNLLQLINQLLDLSKLENKSFKLHSIQSDIVSYLRYVTESFQSFAEELHLTLDFSSTPDSLVMDFDPEQIKQVMTNLISNALKFTPAGGKVSVKVWTSASDQLEIGIEDTGIGISEKDLPHVLDRFFQADSSTTRVAQGTGIGLAHTQELLKVMEGSIVVESELGIGSKILIRLPIRNDEKVEEVDEVTSSGPHLAGRHHVPVVEETKIIDHDASLTSLPQLLIIEDNADVVTYLRSCLEDSYQISVAYDGKKGTETALEEIPDFIISDVMMPKMDGYQVCDCLKNDERTSHIPIILLTAKADAGSRLTGLRRGADAYMAKPFSPEELALQISTLLENRKRMATYFSRGLRDDSLRSAIETAAPEAIQIEDAFIKKVNAIIEANYATEGFSLPELSKEIGMSRSQLLRKIKAIADTSPSDLIRTYRLKKAKALLESGDVSVSEATYQTGFRDPSYFTKLFHDEFGVLPRAVKNSE